MRHAARTDAIFLRADDGLSFAHAIPIALFSTLYTNPLTLIPLYVAAYKLGSRLLYGTAAYLEGLHKGDILVQIGKSDIRGKTQEDVEEMLRGQVGTVIDIAVRRKGNNKKFSLTLSKPEEDAVRHELVKDGIA